MYLVFAGTPRAVFSLEGYKSKIICYSYSVLCTGKIEMQLLILNALLQSFFLTRSASRAELNLNILL